MRQLLLGCVCLGLVALTAWADEKEATPKEIFQELVQKFQKSKPGPAERTQLFGTYAKKLVDYAKANVKDEAKVFDALGYVFQIPLEDGKDSPKAQAVELLKKDFAKSKKIGDFLPRLTAGGADEETISLMKAVMQKNEDKAVKAKACMALAKALEDGIGMALWLKHDASIRGQYEKQVGKEKVKKMVDGLAEQEKELKAALATLRTDYKSEVKKDLYTGAKMPELTSEDLEGKKVKLSGLKGKVVVLDIWATWCPPCRAMIPHEREMVAKFKGKPFELVSVSFDEKKETLTQFLEKEKMPWTHWWNGQGGMIGKELDIRAFPTIYVLDAEGVIRYKGVRNAAMDWAVETLIKEAEEAKKAKTE
jgi:thiol-disulfide isomerase/thioredoxin